MLLPELRRSPGVTVSPQPAGRFGSALAVLDFNRDGVPDLAVGAPAVGSAQLTYQVRRGEGEGWGWTGEAPGAAGAGRGLRR